MVKKKVRSTGPGIKISTNVSGKRMGEEGTAREFGMDMYTLLYFKWITNKDLLYSTGNLIQCYVAAWTGGEFGGEWIYVSVWLSPLVVYLN